MARDSFDAKPHISANENIVNTMGKSSSVESRTTSEPVSDIPAACTPATVRLPEAASSPQLIGIIDVNSLDTDKSESLAI